MGTTQEFELVTVYSRDRERAQQFGHNHGAKAVHGSVEGLLKDSRVDAVFVASPNSLHASHTRQSARAGKLVLTEKPMATTLEDALAMVRECRDSRVKLGTGFELRHHPGQVLARDLISSGTLGPVGLAQGQWGRGVRAQRGRVSRTGLRQWWEQPEFIGDASVMMGLGVHAVDLMRFLLGQEVTEVSAITDGQTEQQPLEHLATMLLRFSGGTIASVCCGRFLPDTRNDFTVYSTDGSITGTATLWEARIVRVQVASESVNRTEVYPYDYLANFISELEDFHPSINSLHDLTAKTSELDCSRTSTPDTLPAQWHITSGRVWLRLQWLPPGRSWQRAFEAPH